MKSEIVIENVYLNNALSFDKYIDGNNELALTIAKSTKDVQGFDSPGVSILFEADVEQRDNEAGYLDIRLSKEEALFIAKQLILFAESI